MMDPPVKQMALERGIRVAQPVRVSEDSFLDEIQAIGSDMIIVVAFGQILKKSLLDIPPWGVINIHASLLPKYRGASPIQRAIMDDESITGLTIMQMEEGLDSGPILDQRDILIQPDETAGRLHDRLSVLGGEMIIGFLDRMAREPVKGVPQDSSRATYASKIEKSTTEIDWTRSARTVSALIRALDPFPGARTLFRGKHIKLFASRILNPDARDLLPGRVAETEKGLYIETGKGIIETREIQYPGKKRLPVQDFLRGFPVEKGAMMGI
jgi:methionyl-tRNA formyltransferase